MKTCRIISVFVGKLFFRSSEKVTVLSRAIRIDCKNAVEEMVLCHLLEYCINEDINLGARD